jgi:hypothetical protein
MPAAMDVRPAVARGTVTLDLEPPRLGLIRIDAVEQLRRDVRQGME